MAVMTKYVQVASKGESDVIDITGRVQKCVEETGLSRGVVTVFVSGSTGAVTTMEYEPGLVRDLPDMLERVAPRDQVYAHQETWNDDNGHSHVKASLIGPSLVVPFVDGKLTLGAWQQIVFLELDIHPRSRRIVLQVTGE
jgi:secondary thiamine-phosphate synthase enzyme